MSSAASLTRRGFAVLGVAIRTEKPLAAVSIIGSVLFGALTVADGLALGWATNTVIAPAFAAGRTTTGAMLSLVAVFLSIAILRAATVVARRVGAGVLQFRMQARSRRAVTRAYLRLPMSWHTQHPTGRLLANANSDVEAAWRPIAPMPMALGTIAMLVFGIVAMLIADPVLAAIACVVFPMVLVANVVFQRRSAPLAAQAQRLRGVVSEVAHESFDGALVVKSMGREDFETRRFEAPTNELRDTNIAVMRWRALFDPILENLPRLGILAVLVVGALRVRAGDTTPGAVVQVAFLFTLLGFPIRSLGWVLGEIPLSVVGYDRVRSVLDAEGEMTYGSRHLPDGPVSLELADVGFGYPASTRRVLHGVTVRVEPGQTVALVGRTGSGKSTLTMLIARLMDPDTGRVGYDPGTGAIPAPELAEGEIPQSVSVVGQQAFLFDDTIRGNVTLGTEFSDDQVWQALRTAQADRFIAALPDGIDTRVGERGTTLSGGQRQRIALARALIRQPALLVLDDATSAVDPQVEAAILAGLRGESAGAVLVIAYRKATIALADEVIHLDDGVIRDRGSHADLVARNAGYRDLVNAYEVEADADA